MKYILLLAACAALVACGGGGSTQDTQTTTTVPDDLATASIAATTSSTVCGYLVGSKSMTGVVTAVHDGDTLTLNGSTKIRLDTIDAPELAQDYGQQAQQHLSNLVMGSTVTVAYSKTDRYGRTVGAVFDASCQYVNLQMVATGNAWFYRAYQCEVDQSVRALFASAEDSATATPVGLWSAGGAEAPWMFRNGMEPTIPVCTSTTSSIAPVPTPATTPVSTPIAAPVTPPTATTTTTTTTSTGCSMVWVNGYRRSNGTWVNGYWRRSPGCA